MEVRRAARSENIRIGVQLPITLLAAFLFVSGTCLAADTLPHDLADTTFWSLIQNLSEPDGAFQSQNLLSNETDYPHIMAELQQTAPAGRAYLGVGPEQNFNYIATLRPKIVFIIDIRRQNLLEHLLYKALFELSQDRVSFVSRLFSRKRPSGLAPNETAAEIFDAYSEVAADRAFFKTNLRDVEELLAAKHHFPLTKEDRAAIEDIYSAFRDFGPLIDYNSRGGGPGGRAFSPSYARLMTETDKAGREWSYLASEERYRVVRDLEMRNLIVPLTGDFGGPATIRAVGQYLRDHGAVVSAFYVSNVEGYLFRGGDRQGNENGGAENFYGNAAMLPLDPSSTFIRWIPGAGGGRENDPSVFLASIQSTVDDFKSRRLTATDLFPVRRFARAPFAISNVGRVSRVSQTSAWVARARIGFYLLAAIAAFLIRCFVWNPVDDRNGSAPARRILYSVVWAFSAFALAVILGTLLRSL